MAVMTTQHLESLGLEEKPIKTISATNDDGRNGIPEVNGHALPAKPDSAPSPAKLENSKTTNEDAFLTNQDLSDKPNGTEHTGDAKSEAPKEEEDALANIDAPTDTEMTDAPAKSPTPPAPQAEEKPESAAVANPPPVLEISTTVATAPADSPASSAISPRTKEDVVMKEGDAMESDDDLPLANQGAAVPRSTQETALSDVAPATPAEEATKNTDAPSAPAVERTSASPVPPPTADTSVSEPSQKLARERDADSEDEPAAKRTKIADAPVKAQDAASPGEDRMDIDQAPSAPSLYRANGEPKHLADVSLHSHKLTDHMIRMIRNILAGVKKTKAGAMFRLPVREIWPTLWNDYSAKVPHPIDISTMEKKLRGDITPGYVTMGDFKNDVYQIVKNSIQFNGESHDVTMAAMTTRDQIFSRMAAQLAVEPAKPEKKEGSKQHTTRHAEPRAGGAAATRPSPAPKKAVVADKPPVVDSPAFAIPANNNGVPLIRRDSTKPDSRTKRPVKPTHSKDLVYDTKRKKLSPELRFCESVLDELKKAKYYDMNQNFMLPVDPVALNIPSYHKIIKKPMDLTTMSKKLAAGEYHSAKDFERDFDLIIKNCLMFNGAEHIIYKQALDLQQLFRREFGKKDGWMAKNAPIAPPPRRTASPALKNDSDDDEADSDAEPEFDKEYEETQKRLAIIQKRLGDEQSKLNDLLQQDTAAIADVEISQSVVALLQKQLMSERSKLASMQPKKSAKNKAMKPKKAGGAPIPSKKVAVGGGGSAAGGASRKAGGIKKAPPKRKMTQAHKNAIATALSELDGPGLNRAIEIIKGDTGQGENDSGELELDIDVLSNEALEKLYQISVKAFPNLRVESEKNVAAPASAESPAPPRHKPPQAKTKKNKPMTKFEQERRIAQLNELRAQAGRQGSGSQEPMESIEGNGTAPAAPPPASPSANVDSDDEESSEEE